MAMLYTYVFVASLAASMISCGEKEATLSKQLVSSGQYTYDFSAPDLELKLPRRLTEISGLTILDDTLLAAIQDEKGEIYILSQTNGDVVNEFRFARNGDYEGIELVDETLYVLRADGDIFKVVNWRTDDVSSEKIETYLATKNDTEGLGYQPNLNRLLVAAKEFPGRGRTRVRSIYAFDLETETLDSDPVYTVPLDTIGSMFGVAGEALRNLLASVIDLESFKPSAVAVHPRTGEVFVVSSVMKAIVVLAESGELVALMPLPYKKLVQPEGIAFLDNGDVFISTEGKHGRGKIFRFNER